MGARVSNPKNFWELVLIIRINAIEQNLPIPKEPIIFSKFTSCLTGPNDEIIIPKKFN